MVVVVVVAVVVVVVSWTRSQRGISKAVTSDAPRLVAPRPTAGRADLTLSSNATSRRRQTNAVDLHLQLLARAHFPRRRQCSSPAQ